MDDSAVFVKTPKGVLELEQRTYGLPSRTRQVLIMADGKRNRASIAGMVSTQELDAVLAQLLKDGFLALVTSQTTAPDDK
jgi:hypothetical protein